MKKLLTFLAAIGRLIFVFAPVLAGIACVWLALPVAVWLPTGLTTLLCAGGVWFLWLLLLTVATTLREAWRRRKEPQETEN